MSIAHSRSCPVILMERFRSECFWPLRLQPWLLTLCRDIRDVPHTQAKLRSRIGFELLRPSPRACLRAARPKLSFNSGITYLLEWLAASWNPRMQNGRPRSEERRVGKE